MLVVLWSNLQFSVLFPRSLRELWSVWAWTRAQKSSSVFEVVIWRTAGRWSWPREDMDLLWTSSQRMFVHIWRQIQREPISSKHISFSVRKVLLFEKIIKTDHCWIFFKCSIHSESKEQQCLWFSAFAQFLVLTSTTSNFWVHFSHCVLQHFSLPDLDSHHP